MVHHQTRVTSTCSPHGLSLARTTCTRTFAYLPSQVSPARFLNMATLQGGIPRVKLESAPDENIKPEPLDTPSPFADEDEDMYEDAGDLDFSQAQQQIWLSHIPRTLWEKLSKLQDDDEIEIGRIRVEGSESNPSRVRLPYLVCRLSCANVVTGQSPSKSERRPRK